MAAKSACANKLHTLPDGMIVVMLGNKHAVPIAL